MSYYTRDVIWDVVLRYFIWNLCEGIGLILPHKNVLTRKRSNIYIYIYLYAYFIYNLYIYRNPHGGGEGGGIITRMISIFPGRPSYVVDNFPRDCSYFSVYPFFLFSWFLLSYHPDSICHSRVIATCPANTDLHCGGRLMCVFLCECACACVCAYIKPFFIPVEKNNSNIPLNPYEPVPRFWGQTTWN